MPRFLIPTFLLVEADSAAQADELATNGRLQSALNGTFDGMMPAPPGRVRLRFCEGSDTTELPERAPVPLTLEGFTCDSQHPPAAKPATLREAAVRAAAALEAAHRAVVALWSLAADRQPLATLGLEPLAHETGVLRQRAEQVVRMAAFPAKPE